MSNNRSIRLLGACMVVMAVLGIILIDKHSGIYINIISFIMLGVVGVSGLAFVKEAKTHQEGRAKQPDLTEIPKAYTTAWRQLWSAKPVLYIFAAVTLLGTVSNILYVYSLSPYEPLKLKYIFSIPLLPHIITPENGWLKFFMSGPVRSTYVSLPMLYPKISLPTIPIGCVLLGIIGIIGLIYIRRHSSTFNIESEEYRKDARYRRLWIISSVIACIIGGLLFAFDYHFMRMLANTHTPLSNNPLVSGFLHKNYLYKCVAGLTFVSSFIFDTAGNGVLMSGLIGSLKRLRSGEQISSSSFVADIITFFKPISLIFLIYRLSIPIFNLCVKLPVLSWMCIIGPLVAVLLMFAPLLAVDQKLSARQAIRCSINLIKKNISGVIPFIGLACFIILIAVGIPGTIYTLLKDLSLLTFIWITILAGVDIVMQALLILALWEFYQQLIAQAPAEAEVGLEE